MTRAKKSLKSERDCRSLFRFVFVSKNETFHILRILRDIRFTKKT
jgi:hypothetical protein